MTMQKLLRINEVCSYLSISRRTLQRLRSNGDFPAPDVLIGKGPRWKEDTIAKWIEERGGIALSVAREATPQHLPLVYIFTERGPSGPQKDGNMDL